MVNRSGLIHVTVLSVKGANTLGLKAPFVELGLHATRHRTSAAKIHDGTSRKHVTWNEDFSLPFNSDNANLSVRLLDSNGAKEIGASTMPLNMVTEEAIEVHLPMKAMDRNREWSTSPAKVHIKIMRESIEKYVALEATKLRVLVAGDWVEHQLPAGVTVASTGQPEVALTPGQDVQFGVFDEERQIFMMRVGNDRILGRGTSCYQQRRLDRLDLINGKAVAKWWSMDVMGGDGHVMGGSMEVEVLVEATALNFGPPELFPTLRVEILELEVPLNTFKFGAPGPGVHEGPMTITRKPSKVSGTEEPVEDGKDDEEEKQNEEDADEDVGKWSGSIAAILTVGEEQWKTAALPRSGGPLPDDAPEEAGPPTYEFKPIKDLDTYYQDEVTLDLVDDLTDTPLGYAELEIRGGRRGQTHDIWLDVLEHQTTLRAGITTGVRLHVRYTPIDCGALKPADPPSVKVTVTGLDVSSYLRGDCYAVVMLGQQRLASQVLNGEWGMQWTLPTSTSGRLDNQKLTVEVWDAASLLKKGRGTFPLDQLLCNKKTRTRVPLEVQPEGSFKWVLPSPPWKLHLALQALSCGGTNLLMEHAPRVVAEVVQAEALPPLKNPVVRLRYGEQAVLTAPGQGTKDVQFGQSFDLYIKDPEVPIELELLEQGNSTPTLRGLLDLAHLVEDVPTPMWTDWMVRNEGPDAVWRPPK
mmetsp:Transcript_132032/g.228828  ORF Transcript_132032/g.228828 Transcript_132032/m.228828 type:complete len:695 (-) Transcript_132032:25-2109(-)